MGLLSRLFRSGESATHAPPSDAVKQGIVLLALSRTVANGSRSVVPKSGNYKCEF